MCEENFITPEKIEALSDCRESMEYDPQGSSITICQGAGFCTQSEEDLEKMYQMENGECNEDEDRPHCPWCAVIHRGDKRGSEEILRDIIKQRTVGRH